MIPRKLCLGTLRGGSGPCEWGGRGRLRIEEDGERMTNQMAGTGSMADEAGAPPPFFDAPALSLDEQIAAAVAHARAAEIAAAAPEKTAKIRSQ